MDLALEHVAEVWDTAPADVLPERGPLAANPTDAHIDLFLERLGCNRRTTCSPPFHMILVVYDLQFEHQPRPPLMATWAADVSIALQ